MERVTAWGSSPPLYSRAMRKRVAFFSNCDAASASQRPWQVMLIRLFQHTTICWGLGLKRQVRKVQRIPDAVVRGRSAGGSEAKESLEGRHGLLSAIVPKDELVEVGLELGAADPVMSADEPLLEVAYGAIGEWYHRRRAFAQFGSQRLSARDVLEAEFLQAGKAFDAIGMNGR